MKSAPTHGGKTGRGYPDTAFQDGPHIYVHKTPCRILGGYGNKFADTNDGGSTYTVEWSVISVEHQVERGTWLTIPLTEISLSG